MKKLINGFVISILILIVFYLIGSFITLTFDVSRWSEASRVLLSFFWVILSVGGFIMAYANEEINEDNKYDDYD